MRSKQARNDPESKDRGKDTGFVTQNNNLPRLRANCLKEYIRAVLHSLTPGHRPLQRSVDTERAKGREEDVTEEERAKQQQTKACHNIKIGSISNIFSVLGVYRDAVGGGIGGCGAICLISSRSMLCFISNSPRILSSSWDCFFHCSSSFLIQAFTISSCTWRHISP